jgi:hypothetical protein
VKQPGNASGAYHDEGDRRRGGLAAVDLGDAVTGEETRVPGRRAGVAEFVRSPLFDAPEAAFDAAFGTSG